MLKAVDWGGIAVDILYLISDSLKLGFDIVSGIFDQAGNNPEEITEKTTEFINKMKKWFKESVIPMLGSLVEAIVTMIKNNDSIGDAIIQGFWDAVFGKDTDESQQAAKISQFMTKMLNPITRVFTIGDFIKSLLFGNDEKTADDGYAVVTVSFSAKLQDTFTDAKRKWDELKEKGKNLVATFASTLKKGYDTARKNWNNLKAKGKNLKATFARKFAKGYESARKNFIALKNKFPKATLKALKAKHFDKVLKTWNSIKSRTATVVADLKDRFTSVIEKILNNAITLLNKLIGTLNKIPGVNIKTIPKVKLARGGIVNNPGRGVNITAGEAGKEAVLPLENNTGWMDILAEKLANKINADNDGILQVVLAIDGETLDKKMVQIKRRRQIRTNGGVV